MILFEDALAIIEKAARSMPVERVGLTECDCRVLAEDIISDIDMPPFNKSAVDGYACRKEDLDQDLKVLEVIAAGKMPQFTVGTGQCSKLMTGGVVPPGADAVIMVEDVEQLSAGIIRFRGKGMPSNICYKAEDLVKGTTVLVKGTLLRPQEIAVLASVGAATPLVYERFRVGIITTGDELVEPGENPGPSQIRNSNAWQLLAQAQRAGCIRSYYGIAVDDEEKTLDLIEQATDDNHIVILTGGISVGDFDFVPEVLKKAGFEIRFRSLAVQPGKPSIFAVRGEKYLFALPGNPVSSFVQFELLVRHLINSCTGNRESEKNFKLPLGFDFQRKRTDRKAFIPVLITADGMIGQVEYHGSAHIHSFIHARGIVSIDIGVSEIRKGTVCDVRLL